MEYPKLRVRQQSVQACTSFRGLDRRPGASSRTRNKSWQWYWHDERNLSADRAPRMSVRNAREWANYIDNNNIATAIAAVCAGDHLVILDAGGYLYSNGYAIDLSNSFTQETAWEIDTLENVKASFSPANGSDSTGTALGGLVTALGGRPSRYVTFRVKTINNSGVPTAWQSDRVGGQYNFADDNPPSSYGITIVPEEPLYVGWTFYVYLWPRSDCTNNTQLIRMGANVLIFYKKKLYLWANAVKLASGTTMTAGTDYGYASVNVGAYLSSYNADLTLCDIDGNAYSGVVVSATEPTQEGYWLDTSSDKPVLQEWSVAQSMWIKLTSTFIKISGFPIKGSGWNSAALQKGDAVVIKTTDMDENEDPLIVQLLNGTHYLYDAGSDNGNDYMIVSGVLPVSSVTVSVGYMTLKREAPEMDFVVEAQNRLWGCRYDESNSINEIYASKLGDFRNWEVYQGLSTDSWRASRGTAAPFTGAIAYGGYPLFFREESLEKVFPSSSGAHQIAVYALDGVQKGCADSVVIINDRLYYKARRGVCVYTGTLPVCISEEFGEWTLSNAKAGRHKLKYVCCMDMPNNNRLCFVYDTEKGDWHVEETAWHGLTATWNDELYYTVDYVNDYNLYKFEGKNAEGVNWWAESDELTMELPEHKWITYIRIRLRLDLGAECRLYIAYDGGDWERKAALRGNRMGTREAMIWPRRCDHFRLRLEGTGGCEVQSISYRVERSQGGH